METRKSWDDFFGKRLQYQKVYAIIIERNSLSWKGNNSETILFSAIAIMFNFIDTIDVFDSMSSIEKGFCDET